MALLTIEWQCKKFNELSPHDLYKILQLRNEIFVVEQNCVFQDADDKDQYAYHLMGKTAGNILVAYARLLPEGITYKEASIGRVITAKQFRGSGAGRQLLIESLARCKQLFAGAALQIGAQLYLKKFYESFGFVQSGDIYLEDGIEHIHMIFSNNN